MCVTLPRFGSGSGVSSSQKARYRHAQSAMPGYFHNSESAVPERQQRPVNNWGLDVQNSVIQVMLSKKIPLPSTRHQNRPSHLSLSCWYFCSVWYSHGYRTASDTLIGSILGEKWEVAQYSSFENSGFWPVVDFASQIWPTTAHKSDSCKSDRESVLAANGYKMTVFVKRLNT